MDGPKHRSFKLTGANIRSPKVSKSWIIGIAIAVLLLAGFYWISIRPTQIRGKCDNLARDVARYETNPNMIRKSDYNFAYQACLHNRGL